MGQRKRMNLTKHLMLAFSKDFGIQCCAQNSVKHDVIRMRRKTTAISPSFPTQTYVEKLEFPAAYIFKYIFCDLTDVYCQPRMTTFCPGSVIFSSLVYIGNAMRPE